MNKRNLGLFFGIMLFSLLLTGSVIAKDVVSCPLNSNNYDKIVNINEEILSQNNGHGEPSESSVINVNLDSGKYTVTLVAADNYPKRVNDSQPNEQYYLSFIKNNNEVAYTSPTDDLEDYKASTQKIQIVETNLNLVNGADSVQAIHAKTSKSANSVIAVCAGIKNNEVTQSFCGDGNLDSGEQCDDGNNNDNDGCSSICEIEQPTVPICGNDIKEQGEECDGENYCSSQCTIIDDEKDRSTGSIEFQEFCTPNWECGGWSECYEGVMKRNCVDTNRCEINYNKPVEQSDCRIKNVLVEDENNNFIWFFAGIVLFLILLIILVNLLR